MKYLSLAIISLVANVVFGQNPNTEKEGSLIITIKPKAGFTLGSHYTLVNNYIDIDTFTIYPTSVSNAPGFRLGVFGDIKIQQRFTLIPRAELSFNYTKAQVNSETLKLDPFNLDFMLHAKWNFLKRDSKVNPYGYLGPGLRVPISGNSSDNFNTKSAWSGDLAFGVDFELNSFYISPEIRLSNGISNIKEDDNWEKLRGSYVAFAISFTGK